MATSAQIQSATEKFVADVDIAHQIVHGAADETVTTDSGEVPTLAGALAQGIISGRNSGTLVFSTQAALYAWVTIYKVLPAKAEVIADPVPENNGIYQNASGGSGATAWLKISNLPGDIIPAQNDGTGSANAVVATSARLPIDGSIVSLLATHQNTSQDVTLEFGSYPATMTLDNLVVTTVATVGSVVGHIQVSYGSTPLAIRTASGQKPAVGSIVPGMPLLGRVDKVNNLFYLMTDIASAAIQASASAYAAQAAASAAQAAATLAASDLTSYSTTAVIQGWFKADGTPLAPVKYDSAGNLYGLGLILGKLGTNTDTVAVMQSDDGYAATTRYYTGTTLKWGLGKNSSGDFRLWNYTAADYTFVVNAANNTVDFKVMPTILGQKISDLVVSGQIMPGWYAFGTSGTFVVPDGIYSLAIAIFGGGGGGGGYYLQQGNQGGIGGFAMRVFDVTPGQSIPFTIGTGGYGGGNNSGGGAGGTTSCAGLTASGGAGGGRSGGSPGAAGIGANGQANGNVSTFNNYKDIIASRLADFSSAMDLKGLTEVTQNPYLSANAPIVWALGSTLTPGACGLQGTLVGTSNTRPGAGGVGGAAFFFPLKG